MKYDFETLLSRKNQGSYKWEQMYEINPNVGEDVVPLSVADMEIKTASEIVEGLKNFLDNAILGYTGPYPDFVNAVKNWCEKRYGYTFDKKSLINTPGVVNAFYGAVNAFTEKGDGVVIFRPVYYPFSMAIEENERELINCSLIEKDGYYTIDFEKFDEISKDPKVKLLIFCNPHNPVGRVWSREELTRLAEICVKNNVVVVSDEIHCDLIMPGHKFTSMMTIKNGIENLLITCFAPSKTFNLAGLATSNIIVPNEELRNKYFKTLSLMKNTMVNVLGYKACEIAYNECEEWVKELLQVLDTNQRMVKKFFDEKFPKIKAPLLEGTYLMWIDFRALGLSNEELEKFMQTKAELFTDEGYIFGEEGNGFERINLAAPTHVIEKTLTRLEKALKNIY